MKLAAGMYRSIERIAPRAVMRSIRPSRIPPKGRVDLGDLRAPRPMSRHFGFDRGLPVDRFYIQRFLAAHADDVRGRTLEVGDDTYTRTFGGDRVIHSDVLHVPPGDREATIVADLTRGEGIPSGSFDCIILTQTLHLIFDVPSAVATLHRILAPGGAVLATVPGISQIDRGRWRDTWFWSFTVPSMTRLFGERFGSSNVEVSCAGNVLAAVAFLEGLAADELREDELLLLDEAYPVCVAIRAVKTDG